jgi:hypothetical protein
MDKVQKTIVTAFCWVKICVVSTPCLLISCRDCIYYCPLSNWKKGYLVNIWNHSGGPKLVQRQRYSNKPENGCK